MTTQHATYSISATSASGNLLPGSLRSLALSLFLLR